MGPPAYGALGATFMITRVLQIVCLLGCIGMAANFISAMAQDNSSPSKELIGTLSVTCTAVLYCIITTILHFDGILSYLINTGTDCLMLIALTVVAAIIGKPLSFLNCKAVGAASISQSAFQLGTELRNSMQFKNAATGRLVYSNWISASKTTCYEMKAVWGLGIALCILFTFSAICSICLWRRSKAVTQKMVTV